MSLIKKIPRIEDIAAVYAVIVLFIYPWTLTRFFWKLPSWTLFSTLGDLANIFAYMMALNFLESLLVLLAPLGLCVLLPRGWFYNRFVSRGVSLVVLGLGYLIFLNRNMGMEAEFPWDMVRLVPLVLLVIPILVLLLDRIGFVRRFLDEVANRAIIFLYISLPISLISVLVVLIRNIV